MKNIRSKLGSIVCWGMLGVFLVSTGCTPTPTPAAVAGANKAVMNTPVPATAVSQKAPVESTATTGVDPSATPTTQAPETAKVEQATSVSPTETAQPTEAATDGASGASAPPQPGFSAWCLPLNTSLSLAKEPLKPPKIAKQATFKNNVLQVHGLPAMGCMFLVTFDHPAPSGLSLELFELKQTTPFLKVDLQPVEGSPETLWAFVQHGAVVSPGRASSAFSLTVTDPLGQVQQKADLKLNSWVQGTAEPKEDDCGCDIGELPTPVEP